MRVAVSKVLSPRSAAALALAISLCVGALMSPPAGAGESLPSVPGISIQNAEPAAPPAPAAAPPKAAAKPASKPAPAKATSSTETAAKSKTPDAAASGGKKGGRSSIAILVNDDPITAYEIEQRAAFIALSSGAGGEGMKAKAEARWQAIIKDPKTNERLKALLREKGVQSQEEARKVQTSFVKDLQRNMIEGLKRESRNTALAGSKGKAQEELIEEKLKLQEAKKLSSIASEAEVDRFVGGIAERNKMTMAQFGDHMKGMGVDISTMRARFLAEISWREVIRRRFGQQITITDRDVDRLVATASGGEDDVELQLQRIAIFLPPTADQKAVAQKLSDAQALSSRFTDCKTTKDLAAGLPGARFQDMGLLRPSNIPEPTRSMLLNARDGDILPPSVAQGSVELWVLCGRKIVTANEQKRENAQAELRQREFEIMAKKHLKDLRNDAAIEFR